MNDRLCKIIGSRLNINLSFQLFVIKCPVPQTAHKRRQTMNLACMFWIPLLRKRYFRCYLTYGFLFPALLFPENRKSVGIHTAEPVATREVSSSPQITFSLVGWISPATRSPAIPTNCHGDTMSENERVGINTVHLHFYFINTPIAISEIEKKILQIFVKHTYIYEMGGHIHFLN